MNLLKSKKNIFLILLLSVLIIVGVGIRSVEVISHNYLFGFDQGRDYLEAWKIAKEGNFTLIGSEWGAGSAGFSGLFHGPFHFYLLALMLVVFEGNPYGGVVLMFLFSIASIGFAFFLGKIVHRSSIAGLIFAALIALSPPLISQARFVWNTHPSTLFILIAFYFVYKFIQKKDSKNLFLAAFFSGFIYNFQTGIAIPLCVSLLLLSVYIIRKRNITRYLFLLLGFVTAFSPIILFQAKNKFFGIKDLFQYVLSGTRESSNSLAFHELLLDHFKSFLYAISGSFPPIKSLSPFIILLLIIIAAVLIYRYEKEKSTKLFLGYLFSIPFISFLVFTQLKNTVYAYYLVSINIVCLLIFSWVLVVSYKKNKLVFSAFSVIFLFFALSALIHYPRTFLYDYSDFGGVHKIEGKKEVIDYLYTDAKGEEFGLHIFTPPVYTYPYEYLLKWYGEKKYGNVPTDKKTGLYYLLIEPDTSKPWSYEGWIETVIKNEQDILETKSFPSGFIVQKRFHGTD